MPDGVDITAGAGTTIATDLVDAQHYQRVKFQIGAEGERADVDGGRQAAADSVPMVLSTEDKAVLDGITTVAGAVAGGHMQADIVGALPAGENVVGLVGASDTVITVTPTVDAGVAYASGDLLFDSTEIANAVRANGYTAILQSVTLLDKADQGVAFTLVFANAATDFGALNSAPDPDDTESGTVIGHVAIAASDYIDLGANRVACLANIGLLLKAGGATTSLYVAGVNGSGTPTYAAGDLVLQLGFLRS